MIRPEKRLQVTEFIMELEGMPDTMRDWYQNQVFGNEDADIEELDASLKESVIRLVEMDPEEFGELSEKAEEMVLRKFDYMEREGVRLSEERLAEGMPEELRTVIGLTQEGWNQLPEIGQELVLTKIDQL
ncbi:unnamed protein product, partial [marine sediment metagenome]